MEIVKAELIIEKCGSNSVIGTLMQSEFSDIIKADGLKGLRTHLVDNHIMLEFKCRLQDKEEIDSQLASLKLGILYSIVSPDLQNKVPQTGQIIAYKAKLKSSDERQWQTYTVHEYKGRWSATMIENTLGAFDNECIFEDFIISDDKVNLSEIIILE